MNDYSSRMADMIGDLKRERDRLKVKIHLAKLEAGDEWQALEAKLQKLEHKVKELGDATGEASENIGAAITLLGQEIRDGLKKIARRI
jgi:hypothetical protein